MGGLRFINILISKYELALLLTCIPFSHYLGVLSVSVHCYGHLHLLCSDALCGGGSARDTIQQHTRCLVVGCGE